MNKTIVMGFGRMNPVSSGHALLANAILKLAQQNRADHVIFLSRTQDAKKNPLSVDQKVKYARAAFPGANIVGANDKIRTFIEAAKSLSGRYANLIMVAGSDRVAEYQTLLEKYNGKDFTFKSIKVVSAGERDPDADNAAGMSATKLRGYAASNDFAKFRSGVPATLSAALARQMFNDVRAGMGINEDYEEDLMLVQVGETVDYQGVQECVKFVGANYVVFESGKRAWLNEVARPAKPSLNDKIRAARVIAMSLGVDDVDDEMNPSLLVNHALLALRGKSLNAESKAIVTRMMKLADTMGIKHNKPEFGAVKEGQDSADFKINAAGRKVRAIANVSKAETPKTIAPSDASESDVVKGAHNLMHNPGIAQQSEYERRRKIQLKVHESEDEDEFDEDELANISDEDVIEYGYDDDEFCVYDPETGELVEHDLLEDTELNEVLSRVERIKAGARMKRNTSKRERKLEIALKRRSSSDVLARRARRIAVKTMEAKLARRPLNTLSVGEKERIEKRIASMKPLINRLAVRLLPRVRQVEKNRLNSQHTQG